MSKDREELASGIYSKMKKKILIASISLLVVIGIGYWVFHSLGGNTPVQIELIEKRPESLAGITYRGTPQDEQLRKNFEEVESQKIRNPGSSLHTIYEVEPAGKLDTMIVFVGINKAFPIAGLEHRTFDEQKYLLAKITGSSWVMPGPKKVQQKLREYALENDLELTGTFIDKIISRNEVQMIAPVK